MEIIVRIIVSFLTLFVLGSTVSASELVHSFKNPTFSGEGYSSHMLTIEQQEFSHKQALETKNKADYLHQ